MIYKENLEQLKLRDSRLYSIISAEDFIYDNTITYVDTAKNGERIVVYNRDGKSVYLNSKYNPAKEAEKYMEDFYDLPEQAILVMFGLSNCAFLKAFLNNVKNQAIYCIIYEPSISIFMQVLHNINMKEFFSDDRIFWVVDGLNDNSLLYYFRVLLQGYNTKTSKFIVLPKYVDLFMEKCNKLVEMGVNAFDYVKMKNNTGNSYGKIICKNSIMNLLHLFGARSEIDFAGKFPKDLTAVLVSAGPSLEKNIQYLKYAKGKALIIVVDTAIPAVLANDVVPDMIVCIDMEKPLKYFEDKRLKEVPFLVTMHTNYNVLDYVQSNNLVFVASNSVFWGNLFDAAGSKLCQMDMGGSVATGAIAVLINWEFKRVILIGQDLALTGNRVHVGEEKQEIEFDKSSYKYVDGIIEDKVLSRLDYYSYLCWIEEMGYRFPWFEIIDATEGGAKKKNTKIMTFKKAIELYCTKEFDMKAVLDKVPRLFVGKKSTLVKDSLIKMDKEMNELKEQAELCVGMCREACSNLEANRINTDKLRSINDFIWRFEKKLCDAEGNYFITESIQTEENMIAEDLYVEEKDDLKETIRMYEKSARYYQAVVDIIPQIKEYISECILRIDAKQTEMGEIDYAKI